MLHASICLGFGMWNMRNGYSFSMGGSISEMIALAMNSNVSATLQGTSAGIRSLSTWKKTVAIRETNEDHIEFVFEDDGDDLVRRRLVSVDQRYQ